MDHDPPRVLAWRMLHEERLQQAPALLRSLYPTAPVFDRDPVALVLAALAVGLALVYLACALARSRSRIRVGLIATATVLLVVLPTLAFVALGAVSGRPYGQDGGVVQLPIAIGRILGGESPYGADYAATMLGRQARASAFWEPLGGNPILRHHAYLPGTHLLMLPGYLVGQGLFGFFDPRLVTLLFLALAVALAFRIPTTDEARLCAAGVAALNPLTWWQQVFGANDVIFVALILGVVLLARHERPSLAAGLLGLACATKQLAWPFAPFLLAHLSGARSLRDLVSGEGRTRLVGSLLIAGAVFVGIVAPVALLDPAAFWNDIVRYNVGLPGDSYPLGGTPGFGFANFLIGYGWVSSLGDYFPFSRFYLLLLPVGLLLLIRQLRWGQAEAALVTGSVALLATLYFSRVVHSNYLIAAAILLPVGALALRLAGDVVVAPLALLLLAVTVAEQEVLRASWDQAAAAGIPAVLPAWVRTLLPVPAPGLTSDPIGLVLSACAAGLGILYLGLGVLRAPVRVRAALLGAALLAVVVAPSWLLATIATRTGVPRGLDLWVAQLPADAARLREGESPFRPPPATHPVGREAWSSSFRSDPPRSFSPDRPLVPPGGPVLAALIGARDTRRLGVLFLGVTVVGAGVLGSRVSPGMGLALVTASGLLAPFALSVVFGGRSLGAVCGLTLTAWLSARRPGLSRLAFGVAVALDHVALAAAPLLALGSPPGSERSRTSTARSLAWVAVGYLALVAPAFLLDPASAMRAYGRPIEVGPGLGLVNLVTYGGPLPRSLPALCALLGGALAVSGVWLIGRCRREEAPLLAAWLCLAVLWLHPAPPAGALALPVALLALAAPLLAPTPDEAMASTSRRAA